ncbi:SpoIIE family protein phosphatase [bacterium]|nr:SpoIIE family protein phosphatase [bacterium]
MNQDEFNNKKKADILIVDDIPANLNVLCQALEPEGYNVIAAPSGEVALKIAAPTPPDLILLDIMMPGIDGFETCRRLKADAMTAEIPVIFITAKDEMESIVEGFQVGGVDYITKPFGYEEIRARVKTHLTIKQLQDSLREANQKLEAQREAAEQELQDARQVQMSLMPEVAPLIEGVEIAGRCLSANTVSGDFFDYFTGKSDNQITLVIADVTGKAMKGAMNAVMTDGILRTAAIEQGQFTPASLMITLNEVLKARLEQYMNVTMVIGMIDSETNTLTLANAAHHAYPILLRHGKIQTLKTGGLPLGMKAGIKYDEEQFPLQSGDVLILMTDGIIETQDSNEKNYSDSGRLENTISQFTPEMPSEAMVDAIINDAIDFGRDRESRDDDMTVVVAKIR